MNDLKCCPFCGQKPNTHITFGKPVIECVNKKCLIAPSTWLHVQTTDTTETIKAWNKRATL